MMYFSLSTLEIFWVRGTVKPRLRTSGHRLWEKVMDLTVFDGRCAVAMLEAEESLHGIYASNPLERETNRTISSILQKANLGLAPFFRINEQSRCETPTSIPRRNLELRHIPINPPSTHKYSSHTTHPTTHRPSNKHSPSPNQTPPSHSSGSGFR